MKKSIEKLFTDEEKKEIFRAFRQAWNAIGDDVGDEGIETAIECVMDCDRLESYSTMSTELQKRVFATDYLAFKKFLRKNQDRWF